MLIVKIKYHVNFDLPNDTINHHKTRYCGHTKTCYKNSSSRPYSVFIIVVSDKTIRWIEYSYIARLNVARATIRKTRLKKIYDVDRPAVSVDKWRSMNRFDLALVVMARAGNSSSTRQGPLPAEAMTLLTMPGCSPACIVQIACSSLATNAFLDGAVAACCSFSFNWHRLWQWGFSVKNGDFTVERWSKLATLQFSFSRWV